MQSIHVSRPELVEMFTSAAQGASVKSSLVRAAVSKQGTPSPFHTYGHTYIHTHTHTHNAIWGSNRALTANGQVRVLLGLGTSKETIVPCLLAGSGR